MTKLEAFAITVEPEHWNKVLAKVDEIAIQTHTNRSAVLRGIVYEHFGMDVEIKPRNFERSMRKAKAN